MFQRILRWKHLSYNDLIICLISEKEDESLPVTKTVPPLPPNILHHRLDLMLQSSVSNDQVCTLHNKIMTYCKCNYAQISKKLILKKSFVFEN